MPTSTSTHKIRQLNDGFRRSLIFGGTALVTPGVQALSEPDRQALFEAVRRFDSFTPDNDPHGEHDFGTIDQFGVRYFLEDRLLRPGPSPGFAGCRRSDRYPSRSDDYARRRVLTVGGCRRTCEAYLGLFFFAVLSDQHCIAKVA